MTNGIAKILKSKHIIPFMMSKSQHDLKVLMNDKLPGKSEIYKLISLSGGFASVSFIKYVAEKENILELTASTLRIGEKQFYYIEKLSEQGKLKKASFFIGSLMKTDKDKDKDKYDYFTKFEKCCEKNKWDTTVANNHSKIVLMRTAKNYFVL